MLRGNRHHCKHLQASWNKYGEDFFKFEVIEELGHSDLLFAAEDVWLKEWVGKKECYNSGRSAAAPMRGIAKEDHPCFGKILSDEEKQKVSNGLKKYYLTNLHHGIGKKLSKETLEKIALNRTAPKGESHYRYGKTLSDETKKKIGDAQRGVKKPEGRRVSPEGLIKLKASARRGEDSFWYGKRPPIADISQKEIIALLPDQTTRHFVSLSNMRDTLGVSVATIIRACKSGQPIRQDVCAGWVLSYADGEQNKAPEIPEEFLNYPRTRQLAKDLGVSEYFTGVPCKRGHISIRKTKGTCVACLRESK